MSRIFWDTNLFIYLLEDYGQLTESVIRLAERMYQREDQLYTSTCTLGELLFRPASVGDAALCREYEEVLNRRSVLLPFGLEAARIYPVVRKDKTIRAPDAIQLACAAQARIDLFIPNDERLSGKTVPGIQFIVPLSKAYL